MEKKLETNTLVKVTAALDSLAEFDERQAIRDAKSAFSPPKKTGIFTIGSGTPTDPDWAEMHTTEEMIELMFATAKNHLSNLSEWELSFVDTAYRQYQAKLAAGFKATNTLSGRQLVVLYRVVQKIVTRTVKVMTRESK